MIKSTPGDTTGDGDDVNDLPTWFKTALLVVLLGGSASCILTTLYLIFRLISKI